MNFECVIFSADCVEDESEVELSVSKTYTLKMQLPFQCTGVSFNASGNTIAVSYGNDHQGFCDHRAGFSVWNLVRRTFDPNVAEQTFETPVFFHLFLFSMKCCVSSVCFHPVMPSIIAVGLYTGEIRVYDLAGGIGDEMVMHSQLEDYTHKEPINNISWIADPNIRNQYVVCTSVWLNMM